MSQQSHRLRTNTTAFMLVCLMIVSTVAAGGFVNHATTEGFINSTNGIDDTLGGSNYTVTEDKNVEGVFKELGTLDPDGEQHFTMSYGRYSFNRNATMVVANNTFVGMSSLASESHPTLMPVTLTPMVAPTFSVGWTGNDYNVGEADDTGATLTHAGMALYTDFAATTPTAQALMTAPIGYALDTTPDALVGSITTNSAADANTYQAVALPSNFHGSGGIATMVSNGAAFINIMVTTAGTGYSPGEVITIPIGAIHASQVGPVVITLLPDDLGAVTTGGAELIVPLCGPIACDDAASTADNALLLIAGSGSLNRFQWALRTDQTGDTLQYSVIPTLADGLTPVDFTFETLEPLDPALGEGNHWVTWASNDMRAYGATTAMNASQMGDISGPDTRPVIWRITAGGDDPSLTPMYSSTPRIWATGITNGTATTGCDWENATGPQGNECNYAGAPTLSGLKTFRGYAPHHTQIIMKNPGGIIINIQVDPNWAANTTAHGGLSSITFDPTVTFGDSMNQDGNVDGDWRMGVDRDGCRLYDYPCTKNGNSGYTQEDDYFEYQIGDGWCDDTGSQITEDFANAGCKMSPLTVFSNHWNVQSYNSNKANFPLFDATSDFDGAVMEINFDRSTFLSRQTAGGWDELALKLYLQNVPDPHGGPGGVAEGAFFRTCWNGALDVYIMPGAHWDLLYGDANSNKNSQRTLAPYASGGPSSYDTDMTLEINKYWGDSDNDINGGIFGLAGGVWDRPRQNDDEPFGQARDYWDINELTTSSPYYQDSFRMGTSTTDFCLDDVTGMSQDGEVPITLDLGGSIFDSLATETASQLVSRGFLESISDSSIDFTMFLDPVGRGGVRQTEFCWGYAKDEIDPIGSDDWGNQNLGNSDTNSCISRNPIFGSSVTFDQWASETPCVGPWAEGDGGAAGSVTPNPKDNYFCGVSLENAWANYEAVKFEFKASSPPPPPPPPPGGGSDADNDGVSDDEDDCPNTPPGDPVDSDGCSTGGPDTEGDCNNPTTPDGSGAAYEDNDKDGAVDEDWKDGIDNDGDGLIDEDPVDDCPNDGRDLVHDVEFDGNLEIGSEHKNGSYDLPSDSSGQRISRSWISNPDPSLLFAENESGGASGNRDKVNRASRNYFLDITGNSPSTAATTVIDEAESNLIKWDYWNSEKLVCISNMGTATTPFLQMSISAFVPVDAGSDSSGGIPSWTASSVPHPEADFDGVWVSYGKSDFDQDGIYSAYSGWEEPIVNTLTATNPVKSQTNKIKAPSLSMYAHLGEGYYMVACQGSYAALNATGVSMTAQATTYHFFVAVEPCDDGTMPMPATPEGSCPTGGGGGGGAEALSDFWSALTTSLLGLGILTLFIGFAAILWFLDQRKNALALAGMGVGVALAYFTTSVTLEATSEDMIGSLAFVFLIAGAFIGWAWPFEDGAWRVAVAGWLIALMGGLNGAIKQGWLDPGIDAIPTLPMLDWLVFALALALALIGTFIALDVVEDPTGTITD
jgi:hypothetical protein